MTAIAEAKEALRKLEMELSSKVHEFEGATGLTISELSVEHTEISAPGGAHPRFLVWVKPRAEVVR